MSELSAFVDEALADQLARASRRQVTSFRLVVNTLDSIKTQLRKAPRRFGGGPVLDFEAPFTKRLDRTAGMTIIPRVHPESAGAVVYLCAPVRRRLPPENERARNPLDVVGVTAVGPADDARVFAGGGPGVSGPPGVEQYHLRALPQKVERRPAAESASTYDSHVGFTRCCSLPLIHSIRRLRQTAEETVPYDVSCLLCTQAPSIGSI